MPASSETPPSATGAGSVPEEVLGPSAHTLVQSTAVKPTLEAADQAYFRGEYAQAVVIYEAVLQQDDKQNPRLFQDLAWCYQQLGNSQKAADNLGKAVQGYRDVLATEPDSTTAQRELESCQAALNTLLTSREHNTQP